MYLPKQFEETRHEVLHGLMTAHPFATLVTLGRDGLAANHLPLLLDASVGVHGFLRGHVARANPFWRDLSAGAEMMAIFQGPQGYVSPSWYPTKAEHGKAVPTWNYCVVHAHGPLRVIEDADWVRQQVTDLTTAHEASLAAPWAVKDAPADYVEGLLKGIVGIELMITRLVGKWKMSQNQPEVNQRGVVAALCPHQAALANEVALACGLNAAGVNKTS